MKKTIARAVVITAVALAAAAAGCGGGDPSRSLSRSIEAASGYVEGGGHVHFVQSMTYRLESPEGGFEEDIHIDGDIVFPDRQRYDYREVAASSQAPDRPQESTFSYITLDGGKTAYVQGERIASQLGVVGWVHYTPPAGQNRYFDFVTLMHSLDSPAGGVELVGHEDIDGSRSAHLRYTIGGRELLQQRFQQDPALEERYGGLDVGQLLGEFTVEIWVREADGLPQRIIVDESLELEEGASTVRHLRVDLSGYFEEPPSPIEKPVVFTEAA